MILDKGLEPRSGEPTLGNGDYMYLQKNRILSRRFDIEHDCHRDSEYSFEQGNSMVNMLIKSLNGMHLNQDHGYQYHIFSVQNTKIRGD